MFYASPIVLLVSYYEIGAIPTAKMVQEFPNATSPSRTASHHVNDTCLGQAPLDGSCELAPKTRDPVGMLGEAPSSK